MDDFKIRSDSVNVEQIMQQIRARIREKRGVDYTEQQIRDLAAAAFERFLDPKGARAGLLEAFRQGRVPPSENYSFEDTTLFDSHRAPLRWIRRLLRPVLKLFFNPNPLIQALHQQSGVNERNAESARMTYELLYNLVLETTRLTVELQALKMRVESAAARLDFAERRSGCREPGAAPGAGDATGTAGSLARRARADAAGAAGAVSPAVHSRHKPAQPAPGQAGPDAPAGSARAADRPATATRRAVLRPGGASDAGEAGAAARAGAPARPRRKAPRAARTPAATRLPQTTARGRPRRTSATTNPLGATRGPRRRRPPIAKSRETRDRRSALRDCDRGRCGTPCPPRDGTPVELRRGRGADHVRARLRHVEERAAARPRDGERDPGQAVPGPAAAEASSGSAGGRRRCSARPTRSPMNWPGSTPRGLRARRSSITCGRTAPRTTSSCSGASGTTRPTMAPGPRQTGRCSCRPPSASRPSGSRCSRRCSRAFAASST